MDNLLLSKVIQDSIRAKHIEDAVGEIDLILAGKAGLADDNTFTGKVVVPTPTAAGEAANMDFVINSAASGTSVLLKKITLTEDVSSINLLVSGDAVTANKFSIRLRFPEEATPQTAGKCVLLANSNPILTDATGLFYTAVSYPTVKLLKVDIGANITFVNLSGNTSQSSINADTKDAPKTAITYFEVPIYNAVKVLTITFTDFIARTGTVIFVQKDV